MDAHQNGTKNGIKLTPDVPAQPDQQYVIQALMEENTALYQNKLYLLAILKQMQAEFAQAQEQWAQERASLIKKEG